MRTLFATTLLAAILVAPAAPAMAGELAGVTMSDTFDAGGQTLTLNGMAVRKKFFVKVYVAGLYLPAKESDAEKILAADQPRHMTMHFVHDVTKKQLCGGWDDGLEANTPNASADVREKFATLCSYMADVDDGQEIVFTYLPGTGTSVTVAGQDKGTIEGKPFADALFAEWIGPDPDPGLDFKKDLLGG